MIKIIVQAASDIYYYMEEYLYGKKYKKVLGKKI